MVWNNEQIKLWETNYEKSVKENQIISNWINKTAIVINVLLLLILIAMPKAKAICPFIWGVNVALFIRIMKYQKLIHYPICILDKIIKQIQKCEPLTKDKTKEEILQDKKAIKIIKKIVRLTNRYEKFMQKYYEKN